MMPNSVRYGLLDLDYELQAPSNEFSYYQMEPSLHVDDADEYTSLLPSINIWNKFDFPYKPSKSSKNATSSVCDSGIIDDYDDDADSEFDPLRGEYATPSFNVTDSCEIRHHDCMWAGRCSSKDHKQIVADAAAAAGRPTARKPMRVVNHRHEIKVITAKPQNVVKASSAADSSSNSSSSKKCVIGLSYNSASLLKAPVKMTSSRSLLRTPLNIVTPNFSKDTSFSLDSDGDSPRPDTPQTSESEDDGDDVLLFKHHLDISSSVSAVCNDDSNDILGYAGYRTHNTTSYSCGVEVEEEEDDDEEDDDDDCDDDDDDEDDDEDDFETEDVDAGLPSTAAVADVSEVTGQRRPAITVPQTATTPTHQQQHFNSDHSYHLSKNVVRLDNLGVQTPSDSEEEIDVVSFYDGEQPTSRSSSCGGTSMPTNPSAHDRQQLQLAVNSAITKRKSVEALPVHPAKIATVRTVGDKIMLDVRTIKKEAPDATKTCPSAYASVNGKVKNAKKRSAASDRECDDVKGRFKGVKRAKHQYHHRLQHHKMMSPARTKKASSTGSSSPRSGCGSSDSEPELEKRSLHNNMERQRRIDLRNLVEGLRLMVPSVENKSRAAKVIILREASNYCQDLTEQYEESTAELAALRQRQNKLRQKVSALRREAAKVR